MQEEVLHIVLRIIAVSEVVVLAALEDMAVAQVEVAHLEASKKGDAEYEAENYMLHHNCITFSR